MNKDVETTKDGILDAKRRLNYLLLNKNDSFLADNEIDIMYSLSKNEQIQKLFKQKT